MGLVAGGDPRLARGRSITANIAVEQTDVISVTNGSDHRWKLVGRFQGPSERRQQ